ncbi:hypothetical protein CCR90_13475 [Rhodovulum sulfidophilum]|uniref:efflux RND transporter periplasmic adaptor subunit n=1 Tax=Rhodovulum sulfidophilum TaxID=35806 RepID=UPI0019116ED4|nr:efflux RND transporter periplasmic adaptor subunit [Rhodovulum sulfidophilum]MBK5924761.1 hypothetical protein [Rhodovulum sulfidophilum]MCE8417431.1 efflux RND transporter periplasmic adaptor subunit [Rhodovulum sulfidophilum]
MFGSPRAILWLGGSGELRTLFGALPEDIAQETLETLKGEKPVIRRLGDRLLALVPVMRAGTAAGHAVWLFDRVPPVTELPALLEELRGLSAAFAPAAVEGDAAPGKQLALPIALSRLGEGTKLKADGVAATVADACVEAGICSAALVVPCTASDGLAGVGRVSASDRGFDAHADEIRQIVASYRPEADRRPDPRRIAAADLDEAVFDAALIGEMLGAGALLLDLPPRGQAGTALILLDPAPGADVAGLADLVSVASRRPSGRGRSRRAKVLRGGMAAIGVALAVWLALPAPLRITATALSGASHAQSVALPFEAFIREMRVEVGHHVEKGDLIAVFTAPDLEEKAAQADLQLSIEQVNAQAALSQNDYGAYVMSEQKQQALRRQIDQLGRRIEQLRVAAPVSGQVIATLGSGVSGRHVPTGTEIVAIQPDDDFNVALTVSRVDAPLVAQGQSGEVYFRGLAGRTWPLTVTTPVAVTRDMETETEHLTAWAHIDAPGEGRLFVGLSGFAKVEVGRTVRAYAYSRYVLEFLKVKAWTWFGFHL